MKKLFILTSVLALGAISSMAQGTINANPANGVKVTVTDPLVANGVATYIGENAVNAGFSGVGPAQVTLSLYEAANGTSLAALESSTPIFTGLNSASTSTAASGTFNAAVGTTSGTTFAITATGTLEFIYYGSGGNYGGWSAEATGIVPATGITTPTAIFGTTAGLINSFNLVPTPEPSTIALGGLGAAALLMFRRRK